MYLPTMKLLAKIVYFCIINEFYQGQTGRTDWPLWRLKGVTDTSSSIFSKSPFTKEMLQAINGLSVSKELDQYLPL